MPKIEAENPRIEKTIKKLIALVEEGGGGIHSAVTIKNTGTELSLHASKEAEGKEIIRLSPEVLLPSNKYQVDVKGDDFVVQYSEGAALSELQKSLLEHMVELYNETGKVKSFRDESFFLSARNHPEIVDVMQTGRKLPEKVTNWIKLLDKKMPQKDIDKFIARSFFQSRYLGYNDTRRMAEDRVVMPVIDFMNHNWFGSHFSIAKGVRAGDLTVAGSMPIEDSTECFAFYGLLDAFDTLVNYNFVDAGTPIVRSVPVVIDVPGFGQVDIDNRSVPAPHKPLAKEIADLRRYLPRFKYEKSRKTLRMTHIFIPDDRSPRSMRRILMIALQQIVRGEKELKAESSKQWLSKAEDEIIAANEAYYKDILATVEALSAKNVEGASVSLSMLKDLAEIQLKKLSLYSKLSDENADNKKAS